MTLSYIDSNKTMESIGAVAGDSMRNGAFGWLWSNYYKYCFNIGQLGEFKQVVKPIGVLNLGFNGIGTLAVRPISKRYIMISTYRLVQVASIALLSLKRFIACSLLQSRVCIAWEIKSL